MEPASKRRTTWKSRIRIRTTATARTLPAGAPARSPAAALHLRRALRLHAQLPVRGRLRLPERQIGRRSSSAVALEKNMDRGGVPTGTPPARRTSRPTKGNKVTERCTSREVVALLLATCYTAPLTRRTHRLTGLALASALLFGCGYGSTGTVTPTTGTGGSTTGTGGRATTGSGGTPSTGSGGEPATGSGGSPATGTGGGSGGISGTGTGGTVSTGGAGGRGTTGTGGAQATGGAGGRATTGAGTARARAARPPLRTGEPRSRADRPAPA